jgi:hypothetical protein
MTNHEWDKFGMWLGFLTLIGVILIKAWMGPLW